MNVPFFLIKEGSEDMVDIGYLCRTSVGGVTVSMVAFQAADPGSTPGQRTFLFLLFLEHKIQSRKSKINFFIILLFN